VTRPRYTVQFAPAAARDLRKLPRDVQTMLAPKIEALASEPRPRGSLKLSGSDNTYRLRVGDYRLLYDITDTDITVLILRVKKRDERTYK
jgi:mRNA interferase RelE/StbE